MEQINMTNLAKDILRIDNPMLNETALAERYAQFTPCRRCGRRVEDNPGPLPAVCADCVEEVLREASEVLYDQLLEDDWSIYEDYLALVCQQ